MSSFGSHLTEARTRAQLSQAALAKQTHISTASICRLEADKSPITLRMLKRLRMVLTFPDLTVDALLNGDDDGAR